MKIRKSLTKFFIMLFIVFCFGGFTNAKESFAANLTLKTTDIKNKIYKINTVTIRERGKFKASIVGARQYKFYSADSSVLIVDELGNYRAKKVGNVKIIARGYNENGHFVDRQVYYVNVYPKTESAMLNTNEATLYTTDVGSAYNSNPSNRVKFKISGINYNMNTVQKKFDAANFSVISSNPNVKIESKKVESSWGELTFSGVGNSTIKINLFGKKIYFKMHLYYVTIQDTTKTVATGTSASIRLYIGKNSQKALENIGLSRVRFGSSRASVATVNRSGIVSTKKAGNAIIAVKVGNLKFGVAVSVTSQVMLQCIANAKAIYSVSTYSQAHRMENGYYDCSSLVWRAYHLLGYNFGSLYWAPTAADIARYLVNHGKQLPGMVFGDNISNYKLQAGDLAFPINSGNGRFMGINHVEIFEGYYFNGFTNNGKGYLLSPRWVTAAGVDSDAIVARP
ncbi:hypothetical protein SAMN05216249_1182 [Acetitomaculum ruminis DSM 5522]|uniref:Ig-like domain (Group 2) n=1 Tax=Acetitomaculum ruminis DSM 5522 TaxID=1120918 RepID=A0A1I0ZWT1_9FIRM|nr:hypothetical protein [Acetitomaculum ruminis]SFB29526.1 hypothetical protein SAMN05216249_1182 [Acetitomaculum ruminis DSM 5522]